jgi:transglutaminase/protease-like cytokinesis protein 3
MRLATTFYIILTFAFLAQGWAQPPEFTDVDFSSADSVASLYPDHPLDNLPQLSHKLTSPFNTEPEKFRSLFKWVCDNIANDYELYAANKKKRETLSGAELEAWNKHIRTITFKTLLDNHTTVCTGYAYLIRELSRQAGLSCEIIDGYGRNVVSNIGGSGIVNHSWNAVRLDGKWYLCDATWASGGIDPQQKVFLPKYNNAYFLCDPGFFVRNHYPQDFKWTLMDNNPSLQ